MRQVENTIPVLFVENLEAAVRSYGTVLGFKLDWTGGATASVSRDGHAIMLQRSAAPRGSLVWIGVEDVMALHRELTDRGAQVVQPPTNEGHALEMKVRDPDGNTLWFGSEPLKDVPFGQPAPLGGTNSPSGTA